MQNERAAGTPASWWRRPRVRARLADAVYVVVGVLVTIAQALEGGKLGGHVGTVLVYLAGAGAAFTLLKRRTRPLLPVVAALPGVFVGNLGVFPLALLALAIRRRDRALWLSAAAGLAVSLVGPGPAAPPGTSGNRPSDLLGNVLTLALAMAVGAYVGARRDLLTSLRARATQAEAELSLRSDQARLAERTRIAQEMHDVLAHRISLIGLHAGGLEVQPEAGPQVVERSARLIRETAHAALEDLRGVLGVLRADASAEGADLAPQPQLADLPRLVASSTAAGVPVTLAAPPGAALADLGVPEVTGRTVYRVVQEALTNVHKHAGGVATSVRLEGTPGSGVVVEVENVRPVPRYGGAHTPLPGAGVGLVGLRERVALAGGSLDAGPTDAGGWRVRAWFPWPA